MPPKKPLSPYLRRTGGKPAETGDEPALLRMGKNVRRLREELGLSQGELGAKCEGATAEVRSQVWISKLERGQIDIHVTSLLDLAKALKTTPSEVLG